MTEQLSRQERRRLMKEEVKRQYINPPPSQQQTQTQQPAQSSITSEQFQIIVQDLQKVFNYIKVVDNHVWMIVETLARKNVIQWAEVNETEQLYKLREEKRKIKVQELLAEDKTAYEYLEAIKEDPHLPGYEKMNINPIKDLNLNPFEVGAILKEQSPGLEEADYINLSKEWKLTGEHFGFRKEEKK